MVANYPKLLSLACALVVLLHCSRRTDATSEANRLARGAPIVVAEALPTKAPPSASSPPAVVEPPPPQSPHTVTDPAFDRFAAELGRACEPKTPGLTTAEMRDNAYAFGRCVYARVEQLAKKLPAEMQRALWVGHASELDKPAFSPAWDRLQQGVCGLDDAASWIGEIARQAGTLRYVDSATCPDPLLVEAAYLLDRLGAPGGAKAFARRVRATEKPGNERLRALPKVRQSLVRLQQIAHEDSLFDDECFYCRLSDADWRRVTLELDAVVDESLRLGRAVCDAWPALSSELGGHERCNAAMRAHFAWYLNDVPTPFGADANRKDYAGYPPPKDPGYRAYIEPLIDTCRAGEHLHYSDDGFEAKALACIRSVAPNRPDQRAVRRAIDAYIEQLCSIEQRVVNVDIGPTTDVHQRLLDDRVEKIECPMLGAEREVYALWTWASGDARRMAEHVRARAVWAPRVRAGSARVLRFARMKTCADTSEAFDGTCRSASLDPSQWSSLIADVASLRSKAALPARALCNGWPELATEIGTDRCLSRLTDYFLSYPVFLGLAALDAN